MATLTLKKAKKIGNLPLYEFDGQYVVMRHARHTESFRFTTAHKTHDSARKEAERLSKASKTERFLVLQIVDSFDWSE